MDERDTTALQELETHVEEQAEQPKEQNLQQQTQVAQETDAQKNFKALREAKERAERDREELFRRVQELESKTLKSQPEIQEDDEDIKIGDDEIAEGKHLSKVAKKIKKLEKQLESYQQQASAQTTEARIKAQFPDFEKVVNKDNIEALKHGYPEVAATLNSSPDLYNTAASAYTLIKRLGIYQEDVYAEDRARAATNASKPRPMNTVSPQQGDSPLSRANAFANGLTEDVKAQLWKEMQDIRKTR